MGDPYRLPRGEPFDFEDEDDELVQVNHLVPESIRDTAQENGEHGEVSEAVRTAYRIVAFGEEFGGANRLEMELRKVQDEKQRTEAKIREVEAELENLAQREEQIKDRIADVDSRNERFEKTLSDLEAMLDRGEAVFEGHAAVQSAARLGSRNPHEIVETLKDRNPDLPEKAFKDQRKVETPWRGETDASESPYTESAADSEASPDK